MQITCTNQIYLSLFETVRNSINYQVTVGNFMNYCGLLKFILCFILLTFILLLLSILFTIFIYTFYCLNMICLS